METFSVEADNSSKNVQLSELIKKLLFPLWTESGLLKKPLKRLIDGVYTDQQFT